MPEGALTSFIVFDAYRYFAGNALLMTSHSRSRNEHLLETDIIILVYWYFNLSKKSNLNGRL